MLTWQTKTKVTGAPTYAQTSFTSFLSCFHDDCVDANIPLTQFHPHICRDTSGISLPGTHAKKDKYCLTTSLPHANTEAHITATLHMKVAPDTGQLESTRTENVTLVPAAKTLYTMCVCVCVSESDNMRKTLRMNLRKKQKECTNLG